MSPGSKTALAAAIAASALTLSACGSSDKSSDKSTPVAANAAVSLAGICPATVTIQTDWHP